MAEKELIPPLLERQSSSMLRTNSNLEKKMMDMRERFRMLQLMEEIEGKDDTNTNVDSPAGVSTKTSARPTSASPSPVPPQNLAAMRWHKLRKVVRTHSNLQTTSKSEYDSPRSARLESDDEDTKGAKQDSKEDLDDDYSISRPSSSRASRPTSAKGSRPPSGKYKSKRSAKKLEQEDQQLADIWSKDSFFQPYEYDKVAQPDLTLPPIPISDIELKFEEDAEPLKLEISRVPEPAIQEKKDTIEKGLFAQHQANIDTIKKLQTDVIWREDLARKRVIEMENVTKERILIEKSKMIKSALDREKNMGQQFRKAREELEEGIRRQEAAVKEHFGRVLVHNESLARRFFVFTKMFPQPIEFRIHLMRAVKDKLPKGAYVLMLTQYDRLGGNPLVWSEIGANGIGKMRPGITKIVRHQGRYYDRVVRFEDSCFALCPPRPRIKPGYIFVLELFQLASHKNPHDKIVAWSAIPMSYESMNIIEGKFKLPMLRGEHTAKIQHFREMESSIASDLSNWLCNIYIEVRHMSLHELGATEEMLKSADFDLDYFNKTVLSDSYLKNHNAALAANKGEVKTFGTEKHKEVIANSPFTPIDLVLPPSASEDVLFQRRQFSNENTRDEELDELDRLEKQIIKEEQDEAGKEKKNAQQKKGKKESEGGLDEQDGVPLLQLPVDKGIFRRKVHQSIDTARDTEGAGGANVSSANYSHSSVSGQPNHSATYSDDEEQQKKNKKAGKEYDNRTASFLDSWLIMVGLKKRAQETAFRSADSQQRLQSNDSFLEHKKQLLKKWKENVEKKFPKHNSPTHEDEYNKDEVVDIRERGYHLQDEAFLHKHQRGKLMGLETIEKRDNRQWAQATLEGKIVRKWQSDGPRFDTEAIRNGKKGDNEVSPRDDGPPSPLRGYYSPRSGKKRFFAEAPMQGAGRAKGETDGIHEDDAESRDFDDNWEELRDPREMQDYQMSIVADPTSRKNLIPGAIAASKIRYLTQELFGDLVPTSFGTFEFYMTILLYLFTFWMRIYVHYLAQYLYILAQSTPVYSFSLHLLFIMFKYSSSSISEAVEVGIVAIGPVANICVFLVMAMFGSAFYKFSGFLPDAFSKLFAYYGVATILDPVLTILVDVCYGHYACFDHSTICAEDYTSAECDCYNGDFVKLWYRVETKEGTGLTGLFITIMIYLGTGVLSCLILHEYLLHVHRDGRILDLWRRVNAPMEEFFIPDDYEISAEELTKILNAARSFKGVLPGVIIKRNIVFHEGIEKDPNDPNFLASYKRIIIYQNESSGKQFIFRHFLMDHTGKITEIFNDSNLKASDLLPKRAFQGLINKDVNTNSNTDGVAAAATGGTIALPPDSSRKSEKDKEGREEKENDERPKSNGSERKTVIKVSANPNSDEVVTNPMVPSLKNMPTSYPPSGSVPSSARSIGRNLPTPSNPLPRGLLPPSQLSSHLNSANVSPRADQNELEDMDGDLDMDLLPKEEDYQHQEELIKQKRKQLKLRDEVELGDDYYNEDRYENDDDEDDYDQGGIDDEEALLANQPKVAQKKKFSPLRKMIKQPNK